MSLTTFLQQCLTGISLGGACAHCHRLYPGLRHPPPHQFRSRRYLHDGRILYDFAMASLPWFIAIPVTLIVTILLGVTIERVAYRPLALRTQNVCYDFSHRRFLPLQNLATYLFTALPKGYPEIPFLKKIFRIGGLSASFVTFLTPVLTLVLVYLLILLINHTKIGNGHEGRFQGL